MESNEEVFNKLGLLAEKYARCIDFLSEKINGVRHHQHQHSERVKRLIQRREEGDMFNLPPVDEYPGDFQMDWEELKSKKRGELQTLGEPLSIEQKIELMNEFRSELIATKNNYLKRADSKTIVQYAEFLENLNEELGL